MKKVISLYLVILMLVLLLSSCGGSSAGKDDAEKGSQPAVATVLDNSNSSTVVFYDMVIRIPDRFGSKTSASKDDTFYFMDSETGSNKCMLMIMRADPKLSESDYQKNEDSFASILQSGFEDKFSDVKNSDGKKQTIGGKNGFAYQFEGKLNGIAMQVYDDFVYVNGYIYMIAMAKSSDIDEDMSGIFQRVIESISIAETSSNVSSDPEPDQGKAENTEMRPEIKEAIDAYEEFMNIYCDFLESFDSSNFSMLAKYAELISKYSEMQKQFDTLGNSDMNDAELAYYTEVALRCSARLMEVSSKITSDMSDIVGSLTG